MSRRVKYGSAVDERLDNGHGTMHGREVGRGMSRVWWGLPGEYIFMILYG